MGLNNGVSWPIRGYECDQAGDNRLAAAPADGPGTDKQDNFQTWVFPVSLRNKIVIYLLLLFAALGGGFYLLQRTLVQPAFERIEAEAVSRDMQRVAQALDAEVEHLDQLTLDWAHWDDTYQFVQQPSDDYIQSNLVPSTFTNAGISLILIYDANGRLLYGQGMDLEQESPLAASQLLDNLDSSNPLLLVRPGAPQPDPQASQRGITRGPTGWLVVSARTILTSNEQGEAVGTLIMARLIDQQMISRLRRQTRLDFTLEPLPADYSALHSPLAMDTVDEKQIVATLAHTGIAGKPLMRIKARFAREISRQGARQIDYLLGFMAALLGLTLLLTLLVLRSQVFRPLQQIIGFVTELQQDQDLSRRCRVEASEETRELSEAFNRLLEQLQERDRALEHFTRLLEQEATEDALTGLANRRKFDQAIRQQWQQAQRSHQPLALLICDIDHFKAYNDHYGHPAGDHCLRQVAELIGAQASRPLDLAARYGGEEFVLLLPETDRKGALKVAQRIQQQLEQAAIPHLAAPGIQRVTLSIGLASQIPQPDHSHQLLLQAADHALYQAKRAGRNRIEVAGTWPSAGVIQL